MTDQPIDFKPRKTRRKTYARRKHMRLIRRVTSKIHKFTRVADFEISVTNNNSQLLHMANNALGYPTTASPYWFSINQLQNSGEFLSLFDQYRITAIDMKFIYSSNAQPNNPSGGNISLNTLPMLIWVKDRDDGSALTSLGDYEQYESYKLKRLDRIVNIRVVPRIATTVYRGAFSGYAQPSGNPWIDANTNDAQYYGIKYAVVISGTGGDGNTTIGKLWVSCKYHLECKDVR